MTALINEAERAYAHAAQITIRTDPFTPAPVDAVLTRRNIVFEGAQGLLLDMDRGFEFPYVTRSNTGIKNVLALAAPAIAAAAAPGQFVMVKLGSARDPLLRRPFSVFEVLRTADGVPTGITMVAGMSRILAAAATPCA